MDPVSIFSVVTGATTAAKLLGLSVIHLALFIKDAKRVNETVEGLHRDVLGLEQALNSVKQPLNSAPATTLQTLQDQEYLALLNRSVKSCEIIAGTLNAKISTLVPSKRLSNPFGKAKLQISILLNEDDIKELRIQADGEKQNIQTALQLLHMSMTRRSEATLDTIREEMFRLIAMVIGMRRYQESAVINVNSHSNAVDRALEGSRRLIQSAQQALSDAGSTLAGSTMGDEISSIILSQIERPGTVDQTRTEEWITNSSTSATLEDTADLEPVAVGSNHGQGTTQDLESMSITKALLHYRDKSYMTPKMAEKINEEMRFVSKSMDVKVALDDALCLASFVGDHASVQGLLRFGASPNARSALCNNRTALIQAVRGNHVKVLQILLKKGSDIEGVVSGDLHSCLEGAPHISASLLFPPWAEYDALSYAATLGHVSAMDLLIARAPDLDQSLSKTRMSPILLAAYEGHADMVQLLLSAGASPNRVMSSDEANIREGIYYGHIALIAAQQGHCKVLEVWKEHLDGIASASKRRGHRLRSVYDMNLTWTIFKNNENGKYFHGSLFHAVAMATPRCKAVQDVLELLIKWGLDINTRDETNGLTPLQIAVNCQDSEVVRLLLRYGASVHARSVTGHTAMHHIMMNSKKDEKSMTESLENLRVLLDDGGDPEITVSRGGVWSLGTAMELRYSKFPTAKFHQRIWQHNVKRDVEMAYNHSFTKQADKLIQQYTSSAP